MEQTKITLKIYEPLLQAFNQELDSLCLKRDAFMNIVLKAELPELRKDLQGRRLSPAARKFISGELKRLGTRNINVVVDKVIAEQFRETVEAANLVRDAFANRMITFLLARPKLLQWLDLPNHTSILGPMVDDFSTSPLTAMGQIFGDPMYYLRHAARETHNLGLYELELPSKFIGFSCFIDDLQVPKRRDQAKSAQFDDAMLSIKLEDFENAAFEQGETSTRMGVRK